MESDDREKEYTHSFRVPQMPYNPDADDVWEACGLMCGSCFGSLTKCLCCYGMIGDTPEVLSSVSSQTISTTSIDDDAGQFYTTL